MIHIVNILILVGMIQLTGNTLFLLLWFVI